MLAVVLAASIADDGVLAPAASDVVPEQHGNVRVRRGSAACYHYCKWIIEGKRGGACQPSPGYDTSTACPRGQVCVCY
jgi:hypothetical protein